MKTLLGSIFVITSGVLLNSGIKILYLFGIILIVLITKMFENKNRNGEKQ